MHKRCGFLLCFSACNQRFGVVVLLSFTDSGLSELDDVDITEELVSKWLIRNSGEDQSKLKYSLGYFAKTDIQKAMMIAKRILEYDNSAYYIKETAMRFIVRHKSDVSEQIAIDYIIDHEPNDPVYMIADGYWE